MLMDLFTYANEEQMKKSAPLAERMRPRTLEEFLGQREVVGPGRPLRRAIEADVLSSIILHGPPGTGKTTLARIIAGATRGHFEQLNAVTAGVADIRRVIKEAEERRTLYNGKTILFIDELHRFNKAQQDALLPYVENGTVILIGATTENPYYEVNSPLLSRSRVFALQQLAAEDLDQLIRRAVTDLERGLGELSPVLEEGVSGYLIQMANGDARAVLNALEAAVAVTEPDREGRRLVTTTIIGEVLQQSRRNYDRTGDEHYQSISAFIKSMRGSDPDGALYWLARMLTAGEDIKFIARRIVICAAEDIGNADPQALVVANAAAQAVQFVGLPEARIILAQAATYLATAPKSNAAYLGIKAAVADLEQERWEPVPVHLHANSPRYLYPHDHPDCYVAQAYLPPSVQKKKYYRPTDRGYEKTIRQYLQRYQPQKHKSGKGQAE